MISFHARLMDGTQGDKTQYSYGWNWVATTDIERIAKCISKFVWSPIQWDGSRLEKNYIKSQFIVLDYDDGMTLEAAKEKFGDFWHIIATTKSHQKPKGKKPPCDRFRVVLMADGEIDNLAYYRSIMQVCTGGAADEKCKDGARFFYPSGKIESMCEMGKQVSIVGCLKRSKPQSTSHNRKPMQHSTDKCIDYWLTRNFNSGLESGSRNQTVFRMAGWLFARGFSHDEICDLMEDSNIPERDFTMEEIRRTVKSATNSPIRQKD